LQGPSSAYLSLSGTTRGTGDKGTFLELETDAEMTYGWASATGAGGVDASIVVGEETEQLGFGGVVDTLAGDGERIRLGRSAEDRLY
jgi:hypothetical protein